MHQLCDIVHVTMPVGGREEEGKFLQEGMLSHVRVHVNVHSVQTVYMSYIIVGY